MKNAAFLSRHEGHILRFSQKQNGKKMLLKLASVVCYARVRAEAMVTTTRAALEEGVMASDRSRIKSSEAISRSPATLVMPVLESRSPLLFSSNPSCEA